MSPAQTFVNKLDHRWRLPPLFVVLLVCSTYKEMFSIRLSEAKENRICIHIQLALRTSFHIFGVRLFTDVFEPFRAIFSSFMREAQL